MTRTAARNDAFARARTEYLATRAAHRAQPTEATLTAARAAYLAYDAAHDGLRTVDAYSKD